MKKILAFGIIAAFFLASCSNPSGPSGGSSTGSGAGTTTGGGSSTTTGTDTTSSLPSYALGPSYSLNIGLLKNYSKVITEVTSFNGTVWNFSGTKQYGTIKNGVLTLVSPTLSNDELYSFSLYSKDLTITPTSAKFYHQQSFYLKQDGDSSLRYFVYSYNSGTPILTQQYVYADTDAKVSGSYKSSSGTKYTFDLDLKKGWNSVEMTIITGSAPEQSYKTAKATTFIWGINDN